MQIHLYITVSVDYIMTEGTQQTCDLDKRYFPSVKLLIFMEYLLLFILKKLVSKFDFIHYFLIVSYTNHNHGPLGYGVNS